MASQASGKLTFVDRDGNPTRIYNGSTDITVKAEDLGIGYSGVGAVQITPDSTTNKISISLDKAAEEAGKTAATATIKDIVGFLGGTAVPPS